MVDIPQIKPHPDGSVLTIQVIPNANQAEIAGVEGGSLRVRINAVPEKGKANKKLIEFLSKAFKIPKSRIHVLRGDTSRTKHILFQGVTVEQLRQLLTP